MVENINVSNLNIDENGRVTFSGLGSGIDFAAAVDNIIAARRIPVDRLETKITDSTDKIAAFDELRGLLNTFRSSLNALRGQITFGGAGNIFQAKEVFASSSSADGTPSAAGNLIGVSVTNAAATGSHAIEVLQVAEAHKLSTASAASLSDDLGLAFGGTSGSIDGSFEINGRLIEVQSTDTLVDLADRINTANSGDNASGVTASIVSVAGNDHILVLTADETGKSIAITNSRQTSDPVADNAAQLDSYTGVTGTGNTFEIRNAAGGTIGTVTYDDTDTLATLDTKIDAISGITANVIQDGSQYRLEIVSDDGSTIQLANDSLGANGVVAGLGFPGDVLADLGISSDGGTNFANELRAAQTAKFRADSLIDTSALQSVAVATATTDFGVAGTIAITLPDETAHNVTVLATDSPSDLATKINNDATLQAAGISASAVQDDDGNIRLEIRQSDLTTTDTPGVLAVRSADPAVDTVGVSGNMTFAFGSSQIKQIAVASGDTLNDVRDAINADADLTAAGVTASVVADGSNFKLVVQHDATLAATGPAGLGLATPELTIERTSNTVDDLFTGMTISLFQAEVGTEIKLDVEQNLTGVRNAITGFVDSYNAVKSFINQQSLVDETTGGPAADAGPLFGNPSLATIEQNLSNILGGGAEGLNSGFQVLREIGIDFTDNKSLTDPLLADTLEIDDATLDDALLNKSEEVRKLFEFDFTSSDPRVAVLGFSGQTQVKSRGYDLDITYSGGKITAATLDGVADSLTINGNVLTATDKTGANGLSFIYTGTASASNITLDFSQGIAHDLFFEIDRLLDSEVGTLETEVDNLTDQNALTQDRIDTMLERLELQRQNLLDRFIAMEAALSTMNNTIDMIRQQTEALNRDN